ncbi:MAG: cobalamin-dependent protein [Phycisphaerae bacterium]|nr:cobalamin-dependent protein [Phycisphaerae bacterium]
MRILLVQPECQSSLIGFRLAAMPEPLALEMVAASAGDHDLRILDMRVEDDLIGALEQFKPDIVVVTALTTEVYAAQDVMRAAKKFSSEIFTVIGGIHASLLPEDFYLPCVDVIAAGEAELNFPQLIDAIEKHKPLKDIPDLIWADNDGNFVRNAEGPMKLDMDALPMPRRDLIEHNRQEYFWLFSKPDIAMATGRGCPFRCNFCSVWQFYKGLTRQMSAKRVVDEIKTVDLQHITFMDDNFLMNYKRETAIAEMIVAEGIQKSYSMECRTDSVVRHPDLVKKWADIGLSSVLLGLEAVSDEGLKGINKGTDMRTNDEAVRIMHDNGVIVWGAFITDPQWETDDFQRLRDYVDRMKITQTQFTVLTPLPGTELYRQRKDELLTDDYTCFDALHAVTPTKLPREEFYKLYAGLYRQTSLTPYYDLVRAGKMTVEDCKRGNEMLEIMSQWELYLDQDPILGNRQKRQAVPANPAP